MSNTSWQVKAKYNAKAYGTLSVKLPKELVEQFKAKCLNDKVSQASVIKLAIEKYLK